MAYWIKNWERFQLYKNKKPGAKLPWIKLYHDLLDDPEWFKLDGEAAKILVMLWIVASDTDGVLPSNDKVCFRLRISETDLLSAISRLSHWVYEGPTKFVHKSHENHPKRKIREEEEKEGAKAPHSKRFHKPTAEEVTSYALSIGFKQEGQRFIDFYDSKGWLVGRTPMKDWKAAVRTWKKRRDDETARPAAAQIPYEPMDPIESQKKLDEEWERELERRKKGAVSA